MWVTTPRGRGEEVTLQSVGGLAQGNFLTGGGGGARNNLLSRGNGRNVLGPVIESELVGFVITVAEELVLVGKGGETAPSVTDLLPGLPHYVLAIPESLEQITYGTTQNRGLGEKVRVLLALPVSLRTRLAPGSTAALTVIGTRMDEAANAPMAGEMVRLRHGHLLVIAIALH